MFRKLLVKNSATVHSAAERLILRGGGQSGRTTSVVWSTSSAGFASKVANRPPKILITGNQCDAAIVSHLKCA